MHIGANGRLDSGIQFQRGFLTNTGNDSRRDTDGKTLFTCVMIGIKRDIAHCGSAILVDLHVVANGGFGTTIGGYPADGGACGHQAHLATRGFGFDIPVGERFHFHRRCRSNFNAVV